MLRRLGALAVAVIASLLGACSGGDDDAGPAATVPVEQSTTSTTAAVDVSAIPAVIDEAYVNRVLAALDAVDGEATRIIVHNRRLVPEATARLRAIYDEAEFRKQVEAWLMELQKGLQGLRPDPGPRKTTVMRVLEKADDCILSSVTQDFSASAIRDEPPNVAYVLLVPLDRSRDRSGLNPTAWMIHEEGYNRDGSVPQGLCAGS